MKSTYTIIHNIPVLDVGSYVLGNHQDDPCEYIGTITEICYTSDNLPFLPLY